MNAPARLPPRLRRRPPRRLALPPRTRWLLAGAAAVVLCVWGAGSELEARARAHAFCDWVEVGRPEAEVAEEARKLEGEVLYVVRPEWVSLGFAGALPPLSRHVCSVSRADGKVTGKTYLHVNALF